MAEIWDQKRIEDYINNKIEENTLLEYKAAASVDSSPGKKKEMAKDVSAMANSAGGIIIYGIQEDPANRHLPGTLDPIKRSSYTREFLDQVINSNIQPRIDGIVIYPVSINGSTEDTVYIVEIPQSKTAHQVTADKDHRYYKRYNFEVLSMIDYEIRDVMNRRDKPDVIPHLYLIEVEELDGFDLYAQITNRGMIPVQNYKLIVKLGGIVLQTGSEESDVMIDPEVWEDPQDPTINAGYSYIDGKNSFEISIRSTEVLFPLETQFLRKFKVFYPRGRAANKKDWVEKYKTGDWIIEWKIFADDMMPKTGKAHITDLIYISEELVIYN